jgi:hypothetical protein
MICSSNVTAAFLFWVAAAFIGAAATAAGTDPLSAEKTPTAACVAPAELTHFNNPLKRIGTNL